MKVMVVGGGGREHAIVKKILENKSVDDIFVLPGNGGISKDAKCINISATDLEGVVKFAAENKIDYAVVAPDDPLVMGLVDMLEEINIPCFGPSKAAAIIEGSKSFAKDLMKKYGIPTARYETFNDENKAILYLDDAKYPIVIKADGLALGKGVIIATTYDEAKNAIISMMRERKFGSSGEKIVIEEFLEGPEVSVLAFTDGKTIVPMVSSMDHKRALDGDKGLNTGGMGTIAPNPFYSKDIAETAKKDIFIPTIEAMKKEGRAFKGCLYFGLMITKNGPKVIEYNCRFGDPEAQVVLPLLKTDLLSIMMKVTEEKLDSIDIEFADKNACCLILASDGYPKSYEKGMEISFEENIDNVFFSGAKLNEKGKLITDGGRVLGITSIGETLESAIRNSYEKADKIKFTNKYYRKDIGLKALKFEEEKRGL